MRKFTLSIVILTLGVVVASAASASAATSVTCQTSGSVKLSPGLSTKPQVQNITIHGSLTSCEGEEASVTGGTYTAHLKTSEPVTCAALTSAGAPTTGTVVLKWSPHGQGNSQAAFGVPLTETAAVAASGLVESGLFAESPITGSLTQSYSGGPTCGVQNGKKKAKKVNEGTIAGTLTF